MKGKMMRNRWGIELKKGYHAWSTWGNRRTPIDGPIVEIDRSSDFARAYGPQVTLKSGYHHYVVGADDISQVLPPMKIGRGGVVKANPLTRTTIDAPSQRERVTERGTTTKRPSARLIERRIKTASTSRKGIYANPLVRVKVNSPSMATNEAPDDRLLNRRRRTAKAPAGFYANPVRPSAKRYYVTVKKPRSSRFEPVAEFKLWEFAVVYGRALRNAHPSWTVKVEERKP